MTVNEMIERLQEAADDLAGQAERMQDLGVDLARAVLARGRVGKAEDVPGDAGRDPLDLPVLQRRVAAVLVGPDQGGQDLLLAHSHPAHGFWAKMSGPSTSTTSSPAVGMPMFASGRAVHQASIWPASVVASRNPCGVTGAFPPRHAREDQVPEFRVPKSVG